MLFSTGLKFDSLFKGKRALDAKMKIVKEWSKLTRMNNEDLNRGQINSTLCLLAASGEGCLRSQTTFKHRYYTVWFMA